MISSDNVFESLNKRAIFQAQSDPLLWALFCQLNTKYFNNQIQASIVWGTNSPDWGLYEYDIKQIRINEKLKPGFKLPRPWATMPNYFLAYVIYHEMLHQLIPAQKDKLGRWIWHSSKFQQEMKKYPHYSEIAAWESSGDYYLILDRAIEFGTSTYRKEAQKAGLIDVRQKYFLYYREKRKLIGFQPTNKIFKFIAEKPDGIVHYYSLQEIETGCDKKDAAWNRFAEDLEKLDYP